MPRPVAWLLFALWLAAAYLLADHARRAAWGPAEALLGFGVWLVLPAVCVPWEVRKLFGPVFAYEVLRLGRRKMTFVLRGLYVLLVMAIMVWVYLLWLDWVRGYRNRDSGVEDWVWWAIVGELLASWLVGWALRGRWRWGVRALGAAAVVVTTFAGATTGGPPVPPAKLASFATWFFGVFVFLQFGVVALLTPAYVAGTVADEKERKTLEFLLATDLAPREILFGKLAARVVSLLMYVLAGLPVVAFLQLFGGIDPDLLLTSTAAAAVTVLGFSAVSIFFSTTLRKPRDAIALAYLLLVAYLFASVISAAYLLGMVMRFGRNAAPWTETLFGFTIDMHPVVEAAAAVANVVAQGNPVWQILLLVEPITGRGGLTPTNMVAALGRYTLFWAVVGGLLMAYSIWRLRPIALGHNKAPTQKVIDRQARRRPTVGSDPMVWKEVFLESGFKGGCVGYLTGLLVVGLVFVWPPIIAYHTFYEQNGWVGRNQWDQYAREINGWVRITTGAVGTLLLLSVAVRGAGAVSGERDRDTWVSLLSTPLGAWEMLRGKWLGCVLGVRRGFALLLAIWAVGLLSRAVEPVMVVAAILALGVYVGAFAWVGILCSLTARTSLVATVRAVAAAAFLAGGFWVAFGMCCLLPLQMLAGGRGRDYDGLTNLFLGFTPAVVLGWLPLRRFERYEIAPFRPEDGVGVLAPVFGLVLWAALGVVLGWTCHTGFKRVTNRGRDDVPTGRRPLASDSVRQPFDVAREPRRPAEFPQPAVRHPPVRLRPGRPRLKLRLDSQQPGRLGVHLPAGGRGAVAGDERLPVHPFGRPHRRRPVGDVDQVEPLVGVADERLAGQQRLAAQHPPRAVEAGEPQHHRIRPQFSEEPFGRQHDLPRLFGRFGRRILVHLRPVRLAVHAGAGDVHQPPAGRQSRQDIPQSLDVHLPHRPAGGAVQPDGVQHGGRRRQRGQRVRLQHVADDRLDAE